MTWQSKLIHNNSGPVSPPMRFRINLKFVYLLGMSCALCSPPVFAEEKLNLDELLQLDIVDLSNIKINVASKREESIAEAPSVISVDGAPDQAIRCQESERHSQPRHQHPGHRLTFLSTPDQHARPVGGP